MTSKVEQENHARQAAEADRLNKKVERESRDAKASETGRDAFAKLVKGQQGDKDAGKKGEARESESRQGEAQAQKGAKQAGEADRAARMARGGVLQQNKALEQARSFHGVLTNQTAQTQEADKGRVERREVGSKKDRVEAEDRGTEIQKQETKRDVEAEQARVEARSEARPNAAINADAGGGGGGNDGRGGEDAAAAAIAQAAKKAGPAVQGPQAAREVKQIPPELLEKLVSAVYLAVNDKGLKEFQIELKDGPLKGGLLKISADDGKIALSFQNLGPEEKRLVEASKGDLMRRLEKKGLSLSRLDVR